MAGCQSLSIFHHSKQAHTLHEASLASSADWLVYPGKTTWRMMQMGWGTGLACCARTRLCIAVGTPGQRPSALRVCKPGSVLSRLSNLHIQTVNMILIGHMQNIHKWHECMNKWKCISYIKWYVHFHMLQWSLSSLPPASLHLMKVQAVWNVPLKAEGFPKYSKVLCWCRHSFPSRFHDPSCTTITLKSSQPTKTKAIIHHRQRQRKETREREKQKMFVLEAEASTCWVVGVQEKKLCVRYFACFSFHWSASFCRGLPPDLLWSIYFYRSSFQCYYTSEQTQAFCNLYLLIPLSESSSTCR